MPDPETIDWEAAKKWLAELDADEESKTQADLLRKMWAEISRLNQQVYQLESQVLAHQWDTLRM